MTHTVCLNVLSRLANDHEETYDFLLEGPIRFAGCPQVSSKFFLEYERYEWLTDQGLAYAIYADVDHDPNFVTKAEGTVPLYSVSYVIGFTDQTDAVIYKLRWYDGTN